MPQKPVGVIRAHQLWTEPPYRYIKRDEADTGFRNNRLKRISHVLAQEVAAPTTDGRIGVGNALPFSRVANPIVAPHKLHYEIPHAGDIGYMRHYRPVIQVSGRTAPEFRDLEQKHGLVPWPEPAKPGASSV